MNTHAVEARLRERVESEIPPRYVGRTVRDLLAVYNGEREPTTWERDTFALLGLPLDVDPCAWDHREERER